MPTPPVPGLKVLIAEDDGPLGRLYAAVLTTEGHEVDLARDSTAALSMIDRKTYGLILLDLTIGPDGGLDLLERSRRRLPGAMVVMITGHATVESAVTALKSGAHDYLLKPVRNEQLLMIAQRALENRPAPQNAGADLDIDRLLGESPRMRETRLLASEVARSDSTVLILGESGTGKSLLARALHAASARAERPFVEAHCALYAEGLLMSELFGHESGAFTGATRRRKGRIEMAEGGTVFLDEIGDMAPAAQLALLRFLQERRFERVGGEETIASNVRVIAATNRDLRGRIRSGQFREDLFYRLNVVPIELPPLRERVEDIPALAARILAECARRHGAARARLAPATIDLLASCSWPGNIREMQNAIERALLVRRSEILQPEDFPLVESKHSGAPPAATTHAGEDGSLEKSERDHILATLEHCRWNKKKAALRLGISRSALYNKIHRLRIGEPPAAAAVAATLGGCVEDLDA